MDKKNLRNTAIGYCLDLINGIINVFLKYFFLSSYDFFPSSNISKII